MILPAPPLYSIRATPLTQVRKHSSLSGGPDHPGPVLAQIPASYGQTHLESHTQERLWVPGYTPSKAHVSSNNQPSPQFLGLRSTHGTRGCWTQDSCHTIDQHCDREPQRRRAQRTDSRAQRTQRTFRHREWQQARQWEVPFPADRPPATRHRAFTDVSQAGQKWQVDQG